MTGYDSSEEEEEEEEAEGGYDCEFVNPPPDAIQAECPICLQILKEPCVIDCRCGQKMCSECVERIKKEGKPCPLCNKTDFAFIRDYWLERYLKSCDVWCSKKKDGCEWRGKLGEFEQHLNESPAPDNQLDGCQFVEVECKHACGRCIQRRYIATHQDQECLERPYSCEHCNEYDSTFEDVTDIHYAFCSKYPVTCPNECRHYPFERQEIEDHLKDDCPLMKVSCPLHYAGCEVELPRKDMPEHMKDTVTHLTLLANVTLSLVKENQELKEKQRATEEKQRVTEEKQKKEVDVFKEEMQQLGLSLRGFPIDFKVNYASKEEVVCLPSFYTHSHGYRMCLEVYPKGNGDGKGTHVSVFTYLMKGPFDDYLKWPFRGEITIQIVNQDGDHDHVEWTAPYNDDTPDDSAGRVTGNKERAGGWGYPQFLAHTDLGYNAARKTQYLKDSIIIVRVVRVKIA